MRPVIESWSGRHWAFYWGPVIVYAGLIFLFSSRSHPHEDLPSFLDLFSDKVLHATEYAGLGGLCYRAFRYGTDGPLASRAALWAIVAASVYGMTDEVHQLFVPLRDSSWQDWLADTIGAGVGAGAALKWFGYRENREPALETAPK